MARLAETRGNMIYFILFASVAAAFAVGLAVGYKLRKKDMPCDTCEFLTRKGGGCYKYCCGYDKYFSDKFNRPPEYCKNYKRRKQDD